MTVYFLSDYDWECGERLPSKGKKIKQLDEQRIRLSFGRNGLTGVTSCLASAIAEWARQWA